MLKVFPAISTVSSVSGGFRGLPLMERGWWHVGQLFVVYVNVVVCKDTNCYFQNLLGFVSFMMNAFYNFKNILQMFNTKNGQQIKPIGHSLKIIQYLDDSFLQIIFNRSNKLVIFFILPLRISFSSLFNRQAAIVYQTNWSHS